MGKSTPSAPPAANPSQVSQQQSLSNISNAATSQAMNNVNQVTPQGSLTYNVTGNFTDPQTGMVVPTYTATTKLSPEQQKLYETQLGVSQGTSDLANQYVKRISDATAQPYNYDSLGPAPTYDSNSATKAAQTLIERNQPQMDRDLGNLTQRLANQGISVGTPAYQAAMDQYQRGVNDFRLGAQSQGQQFATNDYSSAENSYENQIARMTALRTQPINEVATLLGTGSGVRGPQFAQTPQTQVAPTDVMGAYNSAQQQQMQQYQLGLQQQNATTGGLFGLGGSLAGAGAGLYGASIIA